MPHETKERGSRVVRAHVRPAQRKVVHSSRWRLLTLGSLLSVAAMVAALYLLATREGDGTIAVLQTSDFHSLAFSPDDLNVVFFGHHNGVMRSNDGGRTWRPLVERRNLDAMGLAMSPTTPSRLYLAGHDVFQVSADGGTSWQPIAHNLPGTDIHAFAMSPDDSSRLYALVVGHGLFTSADAGFNWARISDRLPGDAMALAVAGGTPETLYVGSMRSGILRSVDEGQSWASAADGLGSRAVMALAVDPVARRTVYAGASGGLYKSTDGGTTWSALPFPGGNAVALAISPARPNVILAINVKERQGLVFRSDDGGATWESLSISGD